MLYFSRNEQNIPKRTFYTYYYIPDLCVYSLTSVSKGLVGPVPVVEKKNKKQQCLRGHVKILSNSFLLYLEFIGVLDNLARSIHALFHLICLVTVFEFKY